MVSSSNHDMRAPFDELRVTSLIYETVIACGSACFT